MRRGEHCIMFLWPQKHGTRNIHRQCGLAHGANVLSVQQMQKCCCDFTNGQLSIMGVDRSGPLVTSSTWVRTDIYR